MPEIVSRSLEGISDLTIAAPIRRGLVPDAFDPCTYATRVRRVLGTLRTLRTQAREAALVRPFTDVVERIQSIHSFRLALLPDADPLSPGRLLLAVTFDRGWEPYVRLLHTKLGPFLDLIFCNCDGYVRATDATFDDYAAWIRANQLDAPYFYADSAQTLGDAAHGVELGRHVRGGASDVDLVGCVPDDPKVRADKVRKQNMAAATRQWLEALGGLYTLTAYHRPGSPDGDLLRAAARDLLSEGNPPPLPDQIPKRIAAALEWLGPPDTPALTELPDAQIDRDDVQRGILRSHDEHDPAHPITHGAMLLLRVADPGAARQYLAALPLASEASDPLAPGEVYVTVALSHAGLARLETVAAASQALPAAFRQGMAARAGLLGDVRGHHPDHWRTPHAPNGRIDLSLVDVVLVLRVSAPDGEDPLQGWINGLKANVSHGLALLAVEPMRRVVAAGGQAGHFRFADGLSQPVVGGAATKPWSDRAAAGDVLCGYPHGRGEEVSGTAWRNGSFLVVRKIHQNMAAMEALEAKAPGVMEKIVGRGRNGAPLGHPAGTSNAFDFGGDPNGLQCPLQSHIRRANPREAGVSGLPPRIMRRGMSYGPDRREGEPEGVERGVMFMAYCGDIAEQFEVIQRWVSGGNSTRLPAVQSDPLLGVPVAGEPRVFRMVGPGAPVEAVDLDGPAGPLTRLEWGLYLFAPSLSMLRGLAPAKAMPAPANRWAAVVAALPREEGAEAREAWLAAFADADALGESPLLWEALRAASRGAVRTPLGPVLTSPETVLDAFRDRRGDLTVAGYRERMGESFGEIFLGLDAGPQYDAESIAVNAAIGKVSANAAFDRAYTETATIVGALETAARAAKPPRLRADLRVDVVDKLLAALSRYYFGIPSGAAGAAIEEGGWSWKRGSERTPLCPGDFIQPSARLFYPFPGEAVDVDGKDQGVALHGAALHHVRSTRAAPQGLIAKDMFAAIGYEDLLARTLIGVIIGFIPTTSGNLLNVVRRWMRTGAFWRLREAMRAVPGNPGRAAAEAVIGPALVEALQAQPVPAVVWRRCTRTHDAGGVRIRPGDTVTLGIAGALGANRAAGSANIDPLFGGVRGPGGPTHACPGREMAWGVMLGALAALLHACPLRGDGTFTVTVVPG